MSQSDFVTRGQALVSAGQYQEAVKVCRLGLLGRPTTVDGRVVLGQALLALKRFDEVIAEMRVTLELDGSSVDAQVLKGEALLRKKDFAQAIDVLRIVRSQAPTDPRIASLYAEAERGGGKPRITASHRSVGFVSPSAPSVDDRGSDAFTREKETREKDTRAKVPAGKARPPMFDDSDDSDAGTDDNAGNYTRPTSLAAPGAKKRTPAPLFGGAAAKPGRPGTDGTSEVDLEEEGIEMDEDDDAPAAPPVPRNAPPNSAGGERGRVMPAQKATAMGSAAAPNMPAPGGPRAKLPGPNRNRPPTAAPLFGGGAPALAPPQPARNEGSSTHELDDEEVMDLETPEPVLTGPKKPGPRTAARNAVQMPSGPIDISPQGAPPPPMHPPPAAHRITEQEAATAHHAGGAPVPAHVAAPHLAQMIANQPHLMHVQPLPQLPPQLAPNEQAIRAAMPTAAAMPMPPSMHPVPTAPPLTQAQAESAAVVDQLFGGHTPNDPYGVPNMGGLYGGQGGYPPQAPYGGQVPPHMMQTQLPYVDPNQQAALAAAQAQAEYERASMAQMAGGGFEHQPQVQAVSLPDYGMSQSGPGIKTGVRRRSKAMLFVWILLGAAMIGGGVFAGFKIRAMRLEKQIGEARAQAVALAQDDAWKGWVGARDRLAGIARASGTIENRAALARVRALTAFEFGDGYEEAKRAVEGLNGEGGLDGAVATAYLGLAGSDAKLAKEGAERAHERAPADAATLYVRGRAALLNGDLKLALTSMNEAIAVEARPLYQIGLAHALGEAGEWDKALSIVDKLLTDSPELASAILERAHLLAISARLAANSPATQDIRARLLKMVSEGRNAPGEQSVRGVSPSQVAYGYVMLALVDHAGGQNPNSHIQNAIILTRDLELDDQRFAETMIDALYSVGLVPASRRAAQSAFQRWPTSLTITTGLARAALAEGDAKAALDAFSKIDISDWPQSLVVRAQAKYALGDTDGARTDYGSALKKSAGYEPALVGLAWLELKAGDIDEARTRIEARLPKGDVLPSAALATVYAATLRAGGDVKEREQARDLMQKIVNGPPTTDLPRAQLELARIYQDLGDLAQARTMYGIAATKGNPEARLEIGLLLLEDRDATGAAQTFAQLVKEAGDGASAKLLLEAARVSMLAGDHVSAQDYLERADKRPDVVRWHLLRERARLFSRRGDATGAAEALVLALDQSGNDVETMMLAAEVATSDDPPQPALVEKVRTLAPQRLTNLPELDIALGKIALATDKIDEAVVRFTAAEQAIIAAKGGGRRRAQATYALAYILYQRGEDVRAENAFGHVVSLDPTLYPAYLYMADLKRNTDAKKALELAQTAMKLNPDSVRGWFLLGVIAAQAGNKKLLDEAITQVNEIAPGSEGLAELQRLKR